MIEVAIIIGCFVLAYRLRRRDRRERRIDIHHWHHFDPPRDPAFDPVPRINAELHRVLREHQRIK
jgi:hypothetical protein